MGLWNEQDEPGRLAWVYSPPKARKDKRGTGKEWLRKRQTQQTYLTSGLAGTHFISSGNSHVFHNPACESGGKISANNLVHYNSRDAAIRAGKKPCAECQP